MCGGKNRARHCGKSNFVSSRCVRRNTITLGSFWGGFTLENQKLRQLRKKQFLYLNLMMVSSFGIVGILINAGLSHRIFYSILALLLTIPLFMKKKLCSNGILLLDSLKELSEYEKQKLGPEYDKREKINNRLNIFMIVIFILQAILPSGNTEVPKLFPFYYGIFVFILLIFINVTQYIQTIKIDYGNINKDFANKTLLKEISIGVIITLGFLGIIMFLIIRGN